MTSNMLMGMINPTHSLTNDARSSSGKAVIVAAAAVCSVANGTSVVCNSAVRYYYKWQCLPTHPRSEHVNEGILCVTS